MHVEVLCLIYFLPILRIIKLDNCTVLMTSSNMLSIINVTKVTSTLNMSMNDTQLCFSTVYVCERVFCCCFFSMCVSTKHSPAAVQFTNAIFLTAVNVKETRIDLFFGSPHSADYNSCFIIFELIHIKI